MKSGTVSFGDPLVDPFFSFFNFSLVYMSILHACMSVHHVHEVSSEAREGEARVKDCFESLFRCWGSNPGLFGRASG